MGMLPTGGVGRAAGRLAIPFPMDGLPGPDGLAMGPIPGIDDGPRDPPLRLAGPGRAAAGGAGRGAGAGWDTAGREPIPVLAGLAAVDGPGPGRDIEGTDGAEGLGPGRAPPPGRIG